MTEYVVIDQSGERFYKRKSEAVEVFKQSLAQKTFDKFVCLIEIKNGKDYLIDLEGTG